MNLNNFKITLATSAMVLALAVPGAAMAYNGDDAVKDCEKRLTEEYKLKDFRRMEAEKLSDDKYKVTGKTKVDDEKHPISCEIKDRHVTSISYDGPKKEGLSDGQKAALGVAAVAAAAAIAVNAKKDNDDKDDFENIDDLVGMRVSSAKSALRKHGYSHHNTIEGNDKSLAYWWNSRKDKCIVVTIDDGRIDKARDQPEVACGH